MSEKAAYPPPSAWSGIWRPPAPKPMVALQERKMGPESCPDPRHGRLDTNPRQVSHRAVAAAGGHPGWSFSDLPRARLPLNNEKKNGRALPRGWAVACDRAHVFGPLRHHTPTRSQTTIMVLVCRWRGP